MSDKKYEDWLELMKDTPKEELLKHHYNLLFKVDKQKEVLDKIKEEVEYWGYDRNTNDDSTFRMAMKKIHHLLEKIK